MLVADKCSGRRLTVLSGEDSDALDLTVVTEKASQILLGEGVREALHEEVALLLGVLEALLLTENLSLTLRSGKSRLNIELEAIDFLIVEVVDSSLSAIRAVVTVTCAVEADESERLRCAIFINFLHNCDRLDFTKL